MEKPATRRNTVEYGHLPYSVQHENVNISIFNLPKKKSLMEKDLLDYTHGYFSSRLFDESTIGGGLAFGRLGDSYAAFIIPGDLSYRKYEEEHSIAGWNYDLILPGKNVYWITEASDISVDDGFKAFKKRIRIQAYEIVFNGKTLSYTSRGINLQLEFSGHLLVDDQKINLQYNRYDSPYIKSKRIPEGLRFSWNGKELYLNFDKMIREEK